MFKLATGTFLGAHDNPLLQKKVKVSPFKLPKAKLGPGHTSGW